METRPIFKKFTDLFKRPKKVTKPASTIHEFPLSPPKTSERITVKRRRRRYYRNPVIIQEPSRDPRFNHALRRIAKKD